MPQPAPVATPLLLAFVHKLRAAGVGVSMVEALDAIRGLEHVDFAKRPQFKAALAATLIKRTEDLPAFNATFEAHFRATTLTAARNSEFGIRNSDEDESGALADEPAAEDLLEAILSALRNNDVQALRMLARAAAQRFGNIDPDRSQSQRYYLYRILRQMDLSSILQRALRLDTEETGELSELQQRLARDEQMAKIEEFRRLIAEAIQVRLAELTALNAEDDPSDLGGIDDVDFLGASAEQLEQMRAAVRPLARKLAARLARAERRKRRGRLDVRHTVRRSLSTGGVPLEPAFRRRKVSKPNVWLLCDVSGSVAPFAEFTLSLLNAMNREFARIRSFAFIDGIEEVTDLFASGETVNVRQLMWRRGIVHADGHSDYGRVFDRFRNTYGRDMAAGKSTVIITGDARNNFRGQGVEDLRALTHQARRLYWLNPEPKAEWDSGDSILSTYSGCCTEVFEVRTLRQLGDFVAGIA